MAAMTRKKFIMGAAACAALRPWRTFGEGAALSASSPIPSRPNLRLGVVSDIHVRARTGQFGTEQLVKALKWFRDCGVDGVVISGDMADDGLVSELQCVADAWNEVFPAGCGVEKLFVYGNHDIEGLSYNPKLKPAPEDVIVTDRAAAWEKVFGEPYEPIWKKSIKGYTFIGAHWVAWKGVPEIERYMAEHADELRGDKPFFYIQHPHPANTCHGPWAWGHDEGFATRALSEFPNAVAISGHSHHPLVDERSIWQGEFTSVGASSLRYIGPMFGRENAGPSQNDDLKQMATIDKFSEQQGLLLSVYDDRLVFERRDFANDGKLGDDWVASVPASSDAPFRFDVRAAAATAPRFSEDAKVSVAGPLDGKDRKGRAARQFVVSFPSALIGAGMTRAYDYEVAAEVEECDVRRVAATKRVYSPGYFNMPERESKTVKCVFALSELGARRASYLVPSVRFRVRAAESFGKTSDAIFSDFVKF